MSLLEGHFRLYALCHALLSFTLCLHRKSFPLDLGLIWGRKHKTTCPLFPAFEGESGGKLLCEEEKGPEFEPRSCQSNPLLPLLFPNSECLICAESKRRIPARYGNGENNQRRVCGENHCCEFLILKAQSIS